MEKNESTPMGVSLIYNKKNPSHRKIQDNHKPSVRELSKVNNPR